MQEQIPRRPIPAQSNAAAARDCVVSTTAAGTTTPSPAMHYRDRRREKPLLSCTFCRGRKIRCDRQRPCTTCISKGFPLSCTYAPSGGKESSSSISVGERIQQLEALVRTLARDKAHTATDGFRRKAASAEQEAQSPQGSHESDGGGVSAAFAKFVEVDPFEHSSELSHGTVRAHSHGDNYVNDVHWAAVLDSLSELKDHYEREEEVRLNDVRNSQPRHSHGPWMLYRPVNTTIANVLAAIPPRAAVDRIIARYFNTQGVTPAIVHSGQFLREYDRFWADPAAAPLAWVGLLFSVLCLSTQYEQLIEPTTDCDRTIRIHTFREHTVHCLLLSQFTRGDPYVLETMINYLASEIFLCHDADMELSLLRGMIIQIALSRGYHRDPENFPNITVLAGEMRRRVWAAIVQMDLRLSSQMGLPHLLQSRQCDTAEPRNLLDSDIDEDSIELPPSRPETEVTPVLYGLAKTRIDKISGSISDLIADINNHPYAEIMDLDSKLQHAEATLPPIFRWQALSESLMIPPQIVMYRVFLQLAVNRLVIWLHRRYLAPAYAQVKYEQSIRSCVDSAVKILEFQLLVDEEIRPGGLLYSARWMQSSLMHSTFLLGMSVVCYYLHLVKVAPNISRGEDTHKRFYDLLREIHSIWLRSISLSREASKAVDHLNHVLGSKYKGAMHNEQGNQVTMLPSAFQSVEMLFDQTVWNSFPEQPLPAWFNTDPLMGLSTVTPQASSSYPAD